MIVGSMEMILRNDNGVQDGNTEFNLANRVNLIIIIIPLRT